VPLWLFDLFWGAGRWGALIKWSTQVKFPRRRYLPSICTYVARYVHTYSDRTYIHMCACLYWGRLFIYRQCQSSGGLRACFVVFTHSLAICLRFAPFITSRLRLRAAHQTAENLTGSCSMGPWDYPIPTISRVPSRWSGVFPQFGICKTEFQRLLAEYSLGRTKKPWF